MSDQIREGKIKQLTSELEAKNARIVELETYVETQISREITLENRIKELSDKIKELTDSNAQLTNHNTQLTENNTSQHSYVHTVIDPRTGFHELPNDATLTMEYGARAYITDVYPGYVWRNCYWYKKSPNLKFTPMNRASILTRLQKDRNDGPVHYAMADMSNNNNHTHAIMINDSFDSVLVDNVRLFARRVVECTNTCPDENIKRSVESYPSVRIKTITDSYHDFYIPATGKFYYAASDISHRDQLRLEHSYITNVYFSDLDTDETVSWKVFDDGTSSCLYQIDAYDCTNKRGSIIPIDNEKKKQILTTGLLQINEFLESKSAGK